MVWYKSPNVFCRRKEEEERRLEELEQKRMEDEQIRLAELHRQLENEKLAKAIEEQQIREREEQERREEEARQVNMQLSLVALFVQFIDVNQNLDFLCEV